MSATTLVERLSDLFGSYKAEWLKDSLYDLFTEPAYFPELTTSRPCVLIGGRGTGKTTVLRTLSYEGQYALSERRGESFEDVPFIGIYYRVNTNRVTAFAGDHLPDADWRRLFGHYLNLVLCGATLKMLRWHRRRFPTSEMLDSETCQNIAVSMCARPASTESELEGAIAAAQSEFEAYVNNVGMTKAPSLSLQGSPLDTLFESLGSLNSFKRKNFFLLIDEFENFLNYQQQSLNTLIKHAGAFYTFKVGVRELGWRVRTTQNENEVLQSPADYVRVEISERIDDKMFRRFAEQVCDARLQRLAGTLNCKIPAVKKLLPSLTDEEEAQELGVVDAVRRTRNSLRKAGAHNDLLARIDDFRLYFLMFWAKGQHRSLASVLSDYKRDPAEWEDRFNEYKYAVLFTIRPSTTGITKFYCGWDVYVAICGKNIRYLLELLDNAFLLHHRSGGKLGSPLSPRTQTLAAQAVAKKNLSELEGLSKHGAHLTKIVLGLGRIFSVMASDWAGHAAEVNQFRLQEAYVGAGEETIKGLGTSVREILTSAVMHLAVQSLPTTKRRDVSDTRLMYHLHPIFSPYFVYSYKRGRDLTLDEHEIAGLITSPRSTIRVILGKSNRKDVGKIPEQLMLFGGYYDALL